MLNERLDKLDQYGRRSMIWVSGVPEPVEVESTVGAVINLVKDKSTNQTLTEHIDWDHMINLAKS